MVVIALPRYEWFNGTIDKFDPHTQQHHVTVRTRAQNTDAQNGHAHGSFLKLGSPMLDK